MKQTKEDFQERYARQMMLPDFGKEGQRKLAEATVLLVGVGGLGSTVAPLLTAAGIGKLILVDGDTVSLSNLQRQILYRSEQTGRPKVDCAAETLHALNPHVEIETHNEYLTRANAASIAASADIIVDGTDNAETRYLLDDLSRQLHIPYVYGSIKEYQGQAAVFNLRPESPSYRDLFPQADSGSPRGVISPLPSLIASVEANEVIKIITGCGEALDGRLLLVDTLTMEFNLIEF